MTDLNELLKKHNGDVQAAANELGISRAALRCRLGSMKAEEIRI